MEFVVSTKYFEGSRRLAENIYITGNFNEKDEVYILLEGFMIEDENLNLPAGKGKGIYNYLTIDKNTFILTTSSDKRNTNPLYYYKNKNNFGISNNVWRLAEIFSDEIEIDEASLKSQLVYFVDVVPGRTMIKDMKRLCAGESLSYDFKTNELDIQVEYEFRYEPDKEINLQEELKRADEEFTKYFTYIKNTNKGKKLGFGCSGGLDSRLIAHYSDKVGMDSEYFVIGDFDNDKFFESVTSLVSGKVAEYYNKEIKKIAYSEKWMERSMLLDIRNNPFFFSQVFLNPVDELPEYDFHISGDPGGVAYLAAPIIEGEDELVKKHADYYLTLRKYAMPGVSDFIRKASHHLGLKLDPYEDKGIGGLDHSRLDGIMGKEMIEEARQEFYDVIDKAPGNNSVEKWYYIHDNITTGYMNASGYTSMSKTKPNYMLYYPYFYEQIKHFPGEYMLNKMFLKKLLYYVNPIYAIIPDQNLNSIKSHKNPISKALNRAELALRGRGLNILRMMKTKTYRSKVKEVFSRSNPVFEKFVNVDLLLRNGIMTNYAGAQLLKLKMVADIIYNKEFGRLVGIKDFEIAG